MELVVAAVQLSSGADTARNVDEAERLVNEAADQEHATCNCRSTSIFSDRSPDSKEQLNPSRDRRRREWPHSPDHAT